MVTENELSFATKKVANETIPPITARTVSNDMLLIAQLIATIRYKALSIRIITFRFIFLYFLSCYILLSCPLALSPACVQRPSGLAQAGLPLPFGRAINFQICTNFRASHCPACAKPPVSGSAFILLFLSNQIIQAYST